MVSLRFIAPGDAGMAAAARGIKRRDAGGYACVPFRSQRLATSICISRFDRTLCVRSRTACFSVSDRDSNCFMAVSFCASAIPKPIGSSIIITQR